MKENTIRQLTDIQHVIMRPGIYIGSTVQTKVPTFVLDESSEKFEYREIEYVPGLLKIIYEVLDNSVDEAIRTGFKYADQIEVCVSDREVSVSDNGRGIPLTEAEGTGKSQLEVALTSLRAGSNFNDEEGRNLLGMNGVGASLTNIFSKEFTAEVYDGERHGLLKCANNLSEKSCTIEKRKRKKTGTSITFSPDLEKFGLKVIGGTHISLVRQRMMFLSFTYPEIKFKFNGEALKFKGAKGFMGRFSDSSVTVQDSGQPCRYLIGVIPSPSDEFTSKSYVNGADCVLGGNHLDVIHSELIGRVREKLAKKYPSIKAGDIKSRLGYIINFREFTNPMFSSQTKESFSSSAAEIKAFLKGVDWDAFAQKVCKCEEIIGPIIESFKVREELQNRKLLDKIGKASPKFKCRKFMPATEEAKYFAIVEGDSACAGLSDGFGRKQIGYFATRGVPLNTYEATPSRIADNEELSNIIKCLNLKLGAKEQSMTYENVLLASDQDADGSHISGLYIGFFSKYCPSVIRSGRLKKLMTPIICMKDGKGEIREMFFDFSEYNSWLDAHKGTSLKTHYYKGLGTWKANELRELVAKYGVGKFIQTLEYDERSIEAIDDWLNKRKADVRKAYLKGNEFSIFSV